MTTLFEAAWPLHPAMLLMFGGAVAALWAIRRTVAETRRASRDPARAFALICGFRRAMIGLCVMALGIGWYWHLPTVTGLAFIIGAEETLESSTVIAVLKRDVTPPNPNPKILNRQGAKSS